MKDEYNTKQIFLVQPTRIDYAIPKNDPIDYVNNGIFRTYHTCDNNGVESISKQMNRTGAESFAKNNNLTIITDYDQDHLLSI